MIESDEVIDFWFGRLSNELSIKEKSRLWYQATPDFDHDITEQFNDLYQQAVNGQLEQWQHEPRSNLALVILLDQMPRNMFRGTAQAFAADQLALEYAKYGIAQGFDKEYALIERIFYYHPFEHSEQLDDQHLSVSLFSSLLDKYQQDEHIDVIEDAVHWAKEHLAIIKQFGRFPHRNEILDRTSSAQELLYLKNGMNFGQIGKK